MKVLEAFGEPISYGGQESFVMNVLNHMDMTDMEADLLTPYYCNNESIRQRIREYGGDVYELGCSFNPGGSRNSAVRPVKRFLRGSEYDVIHIHSGSNSMLAIFARAAYKAGIPRIIVHSHSTGNDDLKHRLSKLVTSSAFRRYPDFYCACSREAGEWRFPADICTGRLRIIPDGIDAEEFRFDPEKRVMVREALGSDDDVIIGNVGRLADQKNQGFLIDLLAEIRNMPGGERYKLLLIGEGENRDKLIRQADDLGIGDAVIFAGTKEDIGDYYQAMDVLAMPSIYEGFGMAALEGQAAGLDVIASAGVPGVVDVTGRVSFIELDDKETWIKAIATDHRRHPENADIIRTSAYCIDRTVEQVKSMYAEPQKKLLTVSVAAYNAEKTLGWTFSSLEAVCDLFDLLDIIIVDDGSSDMTADIAKAFAAKYPDSVRTISKENGGYGSTVNTSIANARGRYFKLLDGDDSFDEEGMRSLIQYLGNADTDLIITPYTETLSGGMRLPYGEMIIDNHRNMQTEPVPIGRANLSKGLAMFEICVRTDVLRSSGEKLTENCFYTDNEFAMIAELYSRTAVKLARPVYRYTIGDPAQSMSVRGRQTHRDDKIRAAYGVFDIYGRYLKKGGCGSLTAEDTISMMVREVYVSHMLMDSPLRYRDVLKMFDNDLMTRLPEIYEISGKSRLVRRARLAGNLIYALMGMKVRSAEEKHMGTGTHSPLCK